MTDPRSRHWARAAAAVVRVDVRRWSRQRMAVLAALVLPLATAALVSAALGGEARATGTVAVADLDGGAAGRAFRRDALGDPRVAEALRVRRVASAAEVRELVEGGEADAGIVIPAGLTASLAAGEVPALDVVRGDGHSVGADLAALVVDSYARRARAVAAVAAAGGGGAPGDAALTVEPVAPGGRALDAAAHYGPAVGLFFVVVALGYAVDVQVADRRLGVADRLASTSAPASAVLAARASTTLALGAASLSVTALAMGVLFGAGWGPPATVGALVVATSFAYAGLAAVLAAVVRTPGQAQGVAAAAAFVLALAGASFAPPGAGVSGLPLADLLPTTVALDGFALAATEGAGVADVAPALAALAGVGALGLVVAHALAAGAGRAPRAGWRRRPGWPGEAT